jgi:hypothetical protein
MTHLELFQLIADAGFTSGWEMTGETLTVWEHEQDPPAPLERPSKNA